MRASRALIATVALTAASIATIGGPPAGGATGTPGSKTFAFVGAAQSFVVPADVCSVTIEAWGAQGGKRAGEASASASSAPGPRSAEATGPGLGGYAKATIAVVPGETLQVNVGGRGGSAESAGGGSIDEGAGGWPDGGAGAANVTTWVSSSFDPTAQSASTSGSAAAGGGGGGGSSDVRRGGAGLADRVVVAGGGGGEGGGALAAAFAVEEFNEFALGPLANDANTSLADAAGGGGGGSTGGGGTTSLFGIAAGTAPDPAFVPTPPAEGGTQTGGGSGGTDAEAGSFGQGGAGGVATESLADAGFPYALGAAAVAAGGGGGGGYYGGGGGGGVAQTAADAPQNGAQNGSLGALARVSVGGGAGGSGFGPAGTIFETGVREGDGQVVLTWTTDPGCNSQPGSGGATAVPVAPRFTG